MAGIAGSTRSTPTTGTWYVSSGAVSRRRAYARDKSTVYRLRHVSGDWRWTQVRSCTCTESRRHCARMGWMIADVSDRKRADEAQARLAAIVESSDNAIVSKDLNGIITTWNRGAERVFGYTAHEAVGQPVTLRIPAGLTPRRQTRIMERIRQGRWSIILRPSAVGRMGRCSMRREPVSPIRDSQGNVVGASKIALDILPLQASGGEPARQRGAVHQVHAPPAWSRVRSKIRTGGTCTRMTRLRKRFRRNQTELYGKSDEELFPPETAAQFR